MPVGMEWAHEQRLCRSCLRFYSGSSTYLVAGPGRLQWGALNPAEPGPCCCTPQAVQNVGNMDTPASRAKEAWMEPLQPTVRQGVAQLKDFITKLVDIEEKEGEHSPWGPTLTSQVRVCSAPAPWPRPHQPLYGPAHSLQVFLVAPTAS